MFSFALFGTIVVSSVISDVCLLLFVQLPTSQGHFYVFHWLHKGGAKSIDSWLKVRGFLLLSLLFYRLAIPSPD